MPDKDKVRLGGMALQNGVLVHGPTSWACAVRAASGEVKVASERKKLLAPGLTSPFLRGPVKLIESVAFLPRLKRLLPEAKLPFEGPRIVVTMVGTSIVLNGVRRSKLGDASKELLAGLLALGPGVLALREGELASYHGAEHIAIGSYEHGEPRAREHERCGTHLAGPMLATSAVGNILAARAPARYRTSARAAAAVGSIAAATELFGWMQRHPNTRLARALARPGYEFQHRIATAEPSPEQLEVAEAALAACLELELTPE